MKNLSKVSEFQKYVTAVKMAELASKGSGDLNKYDHVAKDLYRPNFDDELENVPAYLGVIWKSEHEEDVEERAKMYED